jgi:hypothetical protein
MIQNFSPSAQLSSIFRRIAEEAGYSSGRTYLASILTKMAILSNLIYQAAQEADALERTADNLWRLKWRGLEQLKALTEFRCAIADIIRNIKSYWQSANHSRNTVKENLRWLQSLGLFETVGIKEKPIGHKIKGQWVPLSPDKQFFSFDLSKVLEAYQALEQLLRQQLAIKSPRRKGNPFEMPQHAGMIARMVYSAATGKQYRAFSRLPDGLEDLSTIESKQNRLCSAVASFTGEIEQYSRMIDGVSGELTHGRTIAEIDAARQKAIAAIEALSRQAVFTP